jgi:ribonuclease-3
VRAASAASTAPGPTAARFSERHGTLTTYDELRSALGDPDLDPELLDRALTHRSFAYENGGLPTNERLEFLGDSVLGVVVTETLYRAHPDLSEGRLAKLRAAVVNARALAEVARTIGLGEHIKLGRGEESTGGRDKASILSDTVEAVIGAIYISAGFEAAGAVVHLLFDPLMEAAARLGAGLDWKTSLQELSAEHSLGVPEYVIEATGPDHMKSFTAQVKVADRLYGHGVGRSKKEAEQQAAETAYREIDEAARLEALPVTVPDASAPVGQATVSDD